MDRTADFPRERDFRPGGSAGGPQQSNTNATARGQSKIINHFMDFNGGRTRARTLDPLIKSLAALPTELCAHRNRGGRRSLVRIGM